MNEENFLRIQPYYKNTCALVLFYELLIKSKRSGKNNFEFDMYDDSILGESTVKESLNELSEARAIRNYKEEENGKVRILFEEHTKDLLFTQFLDQKLSQNITPDEKDEFQGLKNSLFNIIEKPLKNESVISYATIPHRYETRFNWYLAIFDLFAKKKIRIKKIAIYEPEQFFTVDGKKSVLDAFEFLVEENKNFFTNEVDNCEEKTYDKVSPWIIKYTGVFSEGFNRTELKNIYFGKKIIGLSESEMKILATLIMRGGKPVLYDTLENTVYKAKTPPEGGLKKFVSKINNKFQQATEKKEKVIDGDRKSNYFLNIK